MSVIVKGMKMPNSCFSCEGCDGNKQYGYYCGLTQDAKDLEVINPSTQKPDWCPLVEVPTPHGRLIDEKELYNKIEREFDGCCVYDVAPYEAVNDFEEIVDQCKTIIQEEE